MSAAAPLPSPQLVSTSLWVRIAYGFGSVAYGVKDNGFNYLLLFYYDQVLGVPARWVGAALLFALLIDAISDPIVGYVSDNWRSRWGRRHPFMYAAALPVAASYWFLWNPPEGLGQAQLLAWLIGIAILVRTLITLYEIPSTAMVSELTDHYDERTSLLSFRYFFGWWGGLTMAVLAYMVFFATGVAGEQGQLLAEGYHAYGRAASVIMLIAIVVSAAGTHHRIPTLKQAPERARRTPREALTELRETLANRSILVLFVAALFYGMAAGLAAGLNIYLNTYFWGLSSEQIGWFNVAYFGSAAIALPLSPWLSRRFGKKQAAIAMSVAALLIYPSLILMHLAGILPPTGSDALFRMLIFFNAADVVLLICSTTLISAMVADVVEESEIKTGRRSEGVFFAARTFAYKAVSGAGLFAATTLLAIIEFPTDASAAVQVGPEVLRRLGVAYVVATVTLYGIAIVFYARYRISRASHAEHLAALADRAAEPGV